MGELGWNAMWQLKFSAAVRIKYNGHYCNSVRRLA